jgi:hypothetical protein
VTHYANDLTVHSDDELIRVLRAVYRYTDKRCIDGLDERSALGQNRAIAFMKACDLVEDVYARCVEGVDIPGRKQAARGDIKLTGLTATEEEQNEQEEYDAEQRRLANEAASRERREAQADREMMQMAEFVNELRTHELLADQQAAECFSRFDLTDTIERALALRFMNAFKGASRPLDKAAGHRKGWLLRYMLHSHKDVEKAIRRLIKIGALREFRPYSYGHKRLVIELNIEMPPREER